jgi:hypothetical protein
MDRIFSRFLLVVALALSVAAYAAQPKPISTAVIPVDLQQVARKAALIFTGTVVSVVPIQESGSEAVSSVAITFQVEQVLRGLRTGQKCTIHEWAGLWASGPRYRVGQRMMLFLYSPSRVGLTSPVGGRLGRYEVDRTGQVVIPSSPALIPPSRKPVSSPPSRPIAAGPQHVPLRTFSRAIRRVMEE